MFLAFYFEMISNLQENCKSNAQGSLIVSTQVHHLFTFVACDLPLPLPVYIYEYIIIIIQPFRRIWQMSCLFILNYLSVCFPKTKIFFPYSVIFKTREFSIAVDVIICSRIHIGVSVVPIMSCITI